MDSPGLHPTAQRIERCLLCSSKLTLEMERDKNTCADCQKKIQLGHVYVETQGTYEH